MSAHTPTPWEVIEVKNEGDYGDGGPDPSSGFDSFAICDANGRTICDTLNSEVAMVSEEADEDGVYAWDEVGKADAAHIVRCVNAHDALVRALKALVDEDLRYFDGYVDRLQIPHGVVIQARLALAAAEAE